MSGYWTWMAVKAGGTAPGPRFVATRMALGGEYPGAAPLRLPCGTGELAIRLVTAQEGADKPSLQ